VRSRIREAIVPGHKFEAGRVKEVVSSVDLPELVQSMNSTFMKFMHPDGGLAVGLVPSSKTRLIWFV
jgi:hypothetical protein